MTDYVLGAESGKFEWKGYPPTIIIHGPDPTTGDTVTRVSAPGAESVARIAPSGEVSLVIEGAEGVGRSGEARVAKQLQSWLAKEGMSVELLSGTDDRGEDRRLRAGDHTLTVQIVTVPTDRQIWKGARKSSTTRAVQLDGAMDWIAESIQKKVDKTTEADRRNIILVLDAQHANPLTETSVVERFVEMRGDPSAKFGFAGVWIVGSSSAHCARLGASVI